MVRQTRHEQFSSFLSPREKSLFVPGSPHGDRVEVLVGLAAEFL
jgi:hypothetical protein